MTQGYIKCDDCGVFFLPRHNLLAIEIRRYYSVIGRRNEIDYCGTCAPKHFKE